MKQQVDKTTLKVDKNSKLMKKQIDKMTLKVDETASR
jgi:hypothetical protein